MILFKKYRESFLLWLLATAWLVSTLHFWMWWLQGSHIGTPVGYILTSFMLAWPMLLPGYCLFFILKTKESEKYNLPSKPFRVAMIVTKAPSEPLSVVQKTLLAAKSQKYTHDTWVADEDPSQEALSWYLKNGISVSCRKGNPKYDNESWPRRRKCKEGNLAYFYDHYGYKKYDIVVQMDADHVASKHYLEKMIAPFSNKNVGYVAAPSICDANANSSWAARARLNSEAMFHGPIQTGANIGWVPVCIGSHYAVRTKALKQIGGIGPELAEDYSTSLTMNAYGWSGVFASDAEAHGDGPNNFNDLVVQDYQWSRSLTTLLISFYSKYWSKLSFKKKIQFTFTQLWYPLSAFVWLLTIVLPADTLLTGQVPVKVDFSQFIVSALLPQIIIFVIFLYVRAKGYLRPKKVKIYSWENALFELARWPWVVLACFDAVLAFITKEERTFKVTSKNKDASDILAVRVMAIYFFIVILDLIALVFRSPVESTEGYSWFVSVTTIMYLLLIFISVTLHIKEGIHVTKTFVLKQSRLYLYSFVLLIALLAQDIFIPEADRAIFQKGEGQISQSPEIDTSRTVESFDLVAVSGDSKWTLSQNAISQYLELKNENLSEHQINKLTYYLLTDFGTGPTVVGAHKVITMSQIEEARQLAGL